MSERHLRVSHPRDRELCYLNTSPQQSLKGGVQYLPVSDLLGSLMVGPDHQRKLSGEETQMLAVRGLWAGATGPVSPGSFNGKPCSFYFKNSLSLQ